MSSPMDRASTDSLTRPFEDVTVIRSSVLQLTSCSSRRCLSLRTNPTVRRGSAIRDRAAVCFDYLSLTRIQSDPRVNLSQSGSGTS